MCIAIYIVNAFLVAECGGSIANVSLPEDCSHGNASLSENCSRGNASLSENCSHGNVSFLPECSGSASLSEKCSSVDTNSTGKFCFKV